MAKFRKKPVIIEADQWYPHSNLAIVKPYLAESDESMHCGYCKMSVEIHGWVSTLEGGHIVCPGDWIVTGIKGEHYPCKPDVFELTYERI